MSGKEEGWASPFRGERASSREGGAGLGVAPGAAEGARLASRRVDAPPSAGFLGVWRLDHLLLKPRMESLRPRLRLEWKAARRAPKTADTPWSEPDEA